MIFKIVHREKERQRAKSRKKHVGRGEERERESVCSGDYSQNMRKRGGGNRSKKF